ncbi:MAG TPA: peptidylprolyl isomerase [Candidatus Acidoferrales bacterium]|nr:peptidylprolyl isomerase [Candidatus Acidoferrales bacterium]
MKLYGAAFGLLIAFGSSAAAQTPSQQTPPANRLAPGRTATPATPAGQPDAEIKGKVLEEVIARVNDEIITTSDLQRGRQETLRETQQGCQGCTPQQVQEKLADAEKNLLRDLIDQSLLVQRGKDLGMSVEADVVKQLDELRIENNLPDLEALQKAVESEGMNWDEFKDHIRDQTLMQQVIHREVQSKIVVEKSDIKKYYDEHQKEFELPETVYIREIFVTTKEKSDAEIPALQKKAEDLRQRVITNGDDFGELAKHFSDGSTAKQGGELGSFQPGQLNKEYEQVFKLNRNEMTPVIRTKDGFVLIQVEERYESGLQPLDKVEGNIEQRLTMEAMQPKIRDFLNTLRRDSFVEVHAGYTDTSGVASTPIVEAAAPPPDKKDKDAVKKRKKFLHIF